MKQPRKFLRIFAVLVLMLVIFALQTHAADALTRAEFCTLAVKLYEEVKGEQIKERSSFSDTKEVDVEKAAAIGVVTGIGDNTFAPGDGVTREQAAVMIVRLAEALNRPLPKHDATFADAGSISRWAIESVGMVQAAQIMNGIGDNYFSPKDGYSVEHAGFSLYRLYSYVITTEIPADEVPLGRAPGQEAAPSAGRQVSRVLELINIERAKANLKPLAGTDPLNAAAAVRASEISTYFSHYRPDGTLCFTVLKEFDIASYTRGENIAGNYRTPEAVVDAWMNSPNHRKYILSPDYTHIGIGFYTDSSGKFWWALMFIG